MKPNLQTKKSSKISELQNWNDEILGIFTFWCMKYHSRLKNGRGLILVFSGEVFKNKAPAGYQKSPLQMVA